MLAEGPTVEHRRSTIDALTATVYVPAKPVEGLPPVSWSMAGLIAVVDGTEAVLQLDDGSVHKVTVRDHRLLPVG